MYIVDYMVDMIAFKGCHPTGWSPFCSVNAVFGPEISAEPNPADTWVAFDYKMHDKESVGILKITDLYGKDVAQFRIIGKQGQQVWDTRWIKSGIYFYTLTSHGLSKSGKIIIK